MSDATRRFEAGRQWFHILFGGALLTGSLLLGAKNTLYAYTGALVLGLLVLHLKLIGARLPLIDWVLKRFERQGVLFPGQGALMYFAGALFVLCFTPFSFALAVIAIVAFGDGFATLVGLYGKWPLPWNPRKKTEGLLAFIFSAAAVASLVIPAPHAIAYATVLGILETVQGPLDDNLLLPMAATALYYTVPF